MIKRILGEYLQRVSNGPLAFKGQRRRVSLLTTKLQPEKQSAGNKRHARLAILSGAVFLAAPFEAATPKAQMNT